MRKIIRLHTAILLLHIAILHHHDVFSAHPLCLVSCTLGAVLGREQISPYFYAVMDQEIAKRLHRNDVVSMCNLF